MTAQIKITTAALLVVFLYSCASREFYLPHNIYSPNISEDGDTELNINVGSAAGIWPTSLSFNGSYSPFNHFGLVGNINFSRHLNHGSNEFSGGLGIYETLDDIGFSLYGTYGRGSVNLLPNFEFETQLESFNLIGSLTFYNIDYINIKIGAQKRFLRYSDIRFTPNVEPFREDQIDEAADILILQPNRSLIEPFLSIYGQLNPEWIIEAQILNSRSLSNEIFPRRNWLLSIGGTYKISRSRKHKRLRKARKDENLEKAIKKYKKR